MRPRSHVLALLWIGIAAVLGPLGGPGVARAEEPVRPPGVPDKALQKRIDEAIERGAKWLRSQQKANGSIGGIAASGGTHYEVGVSALAGLALLAAGDERGSKPIQELTGFLKEKDASRAGAGQRTTYDAGVLIMFLTESYRPAPEPEEKGRTRTARKGKEKDPCGLPDDVKRWVQDLASFLVGARKQGTGTWGYPMHRDDHSNTQYAFLGLRAARDCGAAVPAKVFEEGIATILARQEKDGPKVLRTMPATAPGERPYAFESGDRARGWTYLPGQGPVTGAMTTAAIAILAICHDALTKPERSTLYSEQTERDVQRSVQDGFSWLDRNFAVDKNPGNGAPPWHYYYLYGLERACVYAGRETVGAHDWYIEGAKLLVDQQKEDGRWSTGAMGGKDYESSDACDTAWAILFLKKATRPMPPIQAPVVTEGD